MQPDRAERVAKIVERALDIDEKARASLIADLCGPDTGLREEVASLLAFQDKATDFIEKPAYQFAAEAIVDLDAGELKAGELIGDYEIVSLIGEGGMGEVYLAEDAKLGRKVAIKLLKFGLASAHILRRFQQEERILAGLTHPNIARLYGGAVTANGLPYFVMEYVDGPRLDDYCRDHQLSIPQQLELFRKICAAVSYAHQHLVIHRDIKPANIRMTTDGEPKLLDFGIAKLLDPEANVPDMTMTFAAVMTPQYASPEQAHGEAMTTASDVYSLGVVLYELLTGQKPYKIDSRTPGAVARAIAEQEPTKPSTAIAKRGDNSKVEIRNSKFLKGDLDNIVLKALRKEPERRYGSVGQFSDDIRRYLEGRPVIARKDTLGYRTSKFVRRNKITVAAAALVLLAIISALIVSLWEARNAARQRDLAQQEKLRGEQINDFLQSILAAASPEEKGKDATVLEVLQDATQRIDAEFAKQPDLKAQALLTIGSTYNSLGNIVEAEESTSGSIEPQPAALRRRQRHHFGKHDFVRYATAQQRRRN